MNRLTFNKKTLLEKDFSVDTRGYNPLEVDTFFDAVIKDYESFKIIVEAQKKIERDLTEQLRIKNERIEILENRNEILSDQIEELKNKGLMNIDIFDRLSSLEKKVNEG